MVFRIRLPKPTPADWLRPARVATDAGAIVACVALLGLPLFEWRAAVGIVCFTAAAHQARIALSEYRARRLARTASRRS